MLGLTHPGAAELAARLVEIAPPGLERVFYSESGSTAVEIALKMAFQYWRQREGDARRRTSFVCLTGGYHGDTIGSVSVGGIDLFHGAFGPLLFKTYRVDPGDERKLERVLDLHAREIAAVIVEPLVQGAAGIRVQPPGFLRRVRELTAEHGVLLIADEVATGFGRTGTMFACEQERVAPDLLCLGKGLTGGYLPLAATLATERVYEGFLGARRGVPHLLPRPHLHRQPARLRGGARQPRGRSSARRRCCGCSRRSACSASCSREVARMPEVAEVRGRGFMVGIDLGEHDPALRLGHRVTLEARERGAIVRPLGDTVVLMPPLAISKADLRRLVEIVADSIAAAWDSAYGDRPAARAARRGVSRVGLGGDRSASGSSASGPSGSGSSGP